MLLLKLLIPSNVIQKTFHHTTLFLLYLLFAIFFMLLVTILAGLEFIDFIQDGQGQVEGFDGAYSDDQFLYVADRNDNAITVNFL